MYSLLFRAVKDTLNQLAAQDKWLAAKIGFTAVLHTWGHRAKNYIINSPVFGTEPPYAAERSDRI